MMFHKNNVKSTVKSGTHAYKSDFCILLNGEAPGEASLPQVYIRGHIGEKVGTDERDNSLWFWSI